MGLSPVPFDAAAETDSPLRCSRANLRPTTDCLGAVRPCPAKPSIAQRYGTSIWAAVVVVVAVVAVLSGSAESTGIAAAVGLIWLMFAWRAGIAVSDDGIEVRRFPHAVRFSWSDVDEFRVFSESGADRPFVRSFWCSVRARSDGP